MTLNRVRMQPLYFQYKSDLVFAKIDQAAAWFMV